LRGVNPRYYARFARITCSRKLPTEALDAELEGSRLYHVGIAENLSKVAGFIEGRSPEFFRDEFGSFKLPERERGFFADR